MISTIIGIGILLTLPVFGMITSVGSSHTSTQIRSLVFASSTDTETYSSDPALGNATFLGNAQFVCLNQLYPARCPAGATLYSWPSSGWIANIASIPTSNWIWAPNVTGQTGPAEFKQFFFSRTIHISGAPISGSISIAVDDLAQVYLKGHLIGTMGSVTDRQAAVAAQSFLKTFDLSPFLVSRNNILTIRAENGPFGVCCPSIYSGNPAGVVFGGTITVSNS